MESWAEHGINGDKCEEIYFGKSNRDRTHTVDDKVLSNVDEQNDVRVQVHNFLKVIVTCTAIQQKAFICVLSS